MDLITDLGYLALASRLKRLGERLQEAVSEVYAEQHLSFRARWFPLLAALARESPLPIARLGTIVGLTHTAIAQIAAEMEAAGLVASVSDPRDARRRPLALTPHGAETLAGLQPLWAAVERATAELVAESGHDLLAAVAAVEERLAVRNAGERLRSVIKVSGPSPANLEVSR
ncbi:MAG: MarR family transcriptional regulator [Thermoanaerobaculia bacterium]|nr:MarR family transcriptional regulator [Thermoanaerobaculia bacterium]